MTDDVAGDRSSGGGVLDPTGMAGSHPLWVDPGTAAIDLTSPSMVGSPSTDGRYIQFQGDGTVFCGPYSAAMAANALTGADGSGGDDQHVWTGDELKNWAGWDNVTTGAGDAGESGGDTSEGRSALIGPDGMTPDDLVYMLQAQVGLQASYSTLETRFEAEHPGKVLVEGFPPEHPGLPDAEEPLPLEHPDIEVTVADAERQTSNLGALTDRLRNGHKVIVFVDSDELRAADPDESTEHEKPNHYLVVTGVDEKAGWVVMNDPLHKVSSFMPLTQFEAAWQDSGYGMVDLWRTADTANVDGAAAQDAPPAGSILPVTLVLKASAPMTAVDGVAGPATGP